MTVFELITKLQTMPLEADVKFWDPTGYVDNVDDLIWDRKDRYVLMGGMMARHFEKPTSEKANTNEGCTV